MITLKGTSLSNFDEYMALKKRTQLWEEQYLQRRYLIDVSNDELDQRLRDISLNLSRINEQGQLSSDTSPEHLEKWMPLLHHVFTEYGLRKGIPDGVMNESALPYVSHPEPPNGFKILRGDKMPTSPYLVKLGQKQHMSDFFEKGRIRIAPATNYSDPSLNSAIKDDELSFSSMSLKSEITITMMGNEGESNGAIEPIGNVTITNSALDYYVYCMSNKYDYRLLDDFEANSIVLILYPTAFEKLFLDAVKQLFGENYTYMWIPVYYADPFNVEQELFSVYFAKHFRYAYQNEYRFLMVPKTKQDICLEPFFVELGSMSQIAKLFCI